MRRRDVLAVGAALCVPRCASHGPGIGYPSEDGFLTAPVRRWFAAVEGLAETVPLNRRFAELGAGPELATDSLKVLLLTDMVGTYRCQPEHAEECTRLAHEHAPLVDRTIRRMTDVLCAVDASVFAGAGETVWRNRNNVGSFFNRLEGSAREHGISLSAVTKARTICDRIVAAAHADRFEYLVRGSLAKAERVGLYYDPVRESAIGSPDAFVQGVVAGQAGGDRAARRRKLTRETRLISAGWTVMGIGAGVAGVSGIAVGYGAWPMVFGITAGGVILTAGMIIVIVNAIRAHRQ